MVTNHSPDPDPPPPRLLVVLAVQHRTVAFLEVLRHLCQLRLAVFVAPKTPAGPFLDRLLGVGPGGREQNWGNLGKHCPSHFMVFYLVSLCSTMFYWSANRAHHRGGWAFNNWGKAPSSRESRLLEPWHVTMFSTKILTQVSTVNWMILTGMTWDNYKHSTSFNQQSSGKSSEKLPS